MSNKFCLLTISQTYIGQGSSQVTSPTKTISVPYKGLSDGIIPVPALAAKDTPYAISFGEIEVSATMVRVDNNTDTRLDIKINGASDPSHSIPAGGTQLIAMPVADTGSVPGPLLSMSCSLHAAAVDGGSIDYWVFGDPT